MELQFESIAEDLPGPKWAANFRRHWPAYERWYLSAGHEARPYYLTCLRMLRRHMPELLPTYERLVGLAGGGDLAARFLSLYCPPPYLTACSQAVWTSVDAGAVLVRNYDYNPRLCEGVVFRSAWNGRRVIGTLDCLWGLVDGINEDGLACSLTFGGSKAVGTGFGVPLLLRYVLELCGTTGEAVAALCRIPTHMAYNVTIVDRHRSCRTVYLSPEREAVVLKRRVATNHQEAIEWAQHARATATIEREHYLRLRLRGSGETPERLIDAFLQRPLYASSFGHGYGTLYTAAFRPLEGSAEYRWPDRRWRLSFADFPEERQRIEYGKG